MAFWKKFYKSKYTGAEIDAAVAKAGTVPSVTEDDAGKALVVDTERKFNTKFIYKFIKAPDALNAKINTAILGIASSLIADYKYHRTSVTVNESDPDFNDIYNFLSDMNDYRYLTVVRIANLGDTLTKVSNVSDSNIPSISSYGITAGLGLGEIIIFVPTISTQGCTLDIYARRCEVAT